MKSKFLKILNTEDENKTLSYITNKTLDLIDRQLKSVNNKAFISFSGGKDSNVLLHLVREVNPEVKPVFVDTGIEYKEIIEFNRLVKDIIIIKPKYSYEQIIKRHGYCVISKEVSFAIQQIRSSKSKLSKIKYLSHPDYKVANKWQFLIKAPFKISANCCYYLKKHPMLIYEKQTGFKSFAGYKRSDSRLRNLIKHTEVKRSFFPLLEWSEAQVWEYILMHNLNFVKLYEKEISSSCIPCLCGLQFDINPNKFERLKMNYPFEYDYYIRSCNLGFVIKYLGMKY